jgi:predicted neuraminidase
MIMIKRLSPVLFVVGWGVAFWQVPAIQAPAFAPPAPAKSSELPAEFVQEKLPPVAKLSHASSVTELGDGRLAIAWYAGSYERANDVQIWFSIRDARGWSTPRVIATRASTARETGTIVWSLGNPVLFSNGNRLNLWYVSTPVNGWSGSSINYKFSDDNGEAWSNAEKLVTSPFFNAGTLGRTSAVALADGGLGLPVYQELFVRSAEWLRLDPTGRIVGKSRLPSPAQGLQPAVAAIDRQHAIAFLRSADKINGTVMAETTGDGGANWQSSDSLPIPNFDSSLAVLRLQSGRLLLAANPKRTRNLLQLFFSDDDGRHWQPARVIESDPEETAQFSYPSVVQTTDGRVHLTYTYRYFTIAHASFTEAAIVEGRS